MRHCHSHSVDFVPGALSWKFSGLAVPRPPATAPTGMDLFADAPLLCDIARPGEEKQFCDLAEKKHSYSSCPRFTGGKAAPRVMLILLVNIRFPHLQIVLALSLSFTSSTWQVMLQVAQDVPWRSASERWDLLAARPHTTCGAPRRRVPADIVNTWRSLAAFEGAGRAVGVRLRLPPVWAP